MSSSEKFSRTKIEGNDPIRKAIRRIRRDKDYAAYPRLLSELFLMKDAFGHAFPYVPLSFQNVWHMRFWLINPDALHRLWTKGRGIGATAITMMDLIVLGRCYDGLKIPITSITSTQVQMGPIEWGQWLCDHTKVPDLIGRDVDVSREIRINDTGSVIFKIPGGNPDALRTYRCPVVFYDEFDYCDQNKRLLDAGNRTMSEGGQATMVSTIRSATGEFQKIIDHADELGYWVHKTPIFPIDKFDVTKEIPLQMEEYNFAPIAPWLHLESLERERIRDPQAFLRENQCQAPDYGSNYLDWGLINKCCTMTFRGEQQRRWIKTGREPDNHNPIQIGWDFARSFDISAGEVFEEIDGIWTQVYEVLMRGSDTPTQNKTLDSLVEQFRPDHVRIDMTGNGSGFYDYARAKYRHLVEGVHFSRKKRVGWHKAKPILDTMKNLMAVNLRNHMIDDDVVLFDYLALKHDLHSVPYDLRDPQRTEEGSHGDRFWATALAIYPAGRRGGMRIGFAKRPR